MTKIFLSGLGIDIFNKDNNNNNKDIYLIYEFYEILDVYRKYFLMNKSQINNIINRFVELKKNEDGEVNKIIHSIDDLFKYISTEENFQKK